MKQYHLLMIIYKTYKHLFELHLEKAKLDSAGIESHSLDENQDAYIGEVIGQGYRLQIKEMDLERVQEILENKESTEPVSSKSHNKVVYLISGLLLFIFLPDHINNIILFIEESGNLQPTHRLLIITSIGISVLNIASIIGFAMRKNWAWYSLVFILVWYAQRDVSIAYLFYSFVPLIWMSTVLIAFILFYLFTTHVRSNFSIRLVFVPLLIIPSAAFYLFVFLNYQPARTLSDLYLERRDYGILFYKDIPYSGLYKNVNQHGYTESGKMVNGFEEGLWRITDNEGVLIIEERYKNGDLNGKAKYLRGSDLAYSIVTYKMNYLDGPAEYFDQYGNDSLSGTYNMDEQEGIWKYYIHGELSHELEYHNGFKDGVQIEYENGIKTVEGSVERGTKVGVWKYWNEKGELSKKETFDNGELVNIETFE